jgi:hypothetical protein
MVCLLRRGWCWLGDPSLQVGEVIVETLLPLERLESCFERILDEYLGRRRAATRFRVAKLPLHQAHSVGSCLIDFAKSGGPSSVFRATSTCFGGQTFLTA